MSASRERKKRTEQVEQPVVKKETKKLSEGRIFAICMVALAVVLIGILVGVTIYKNNRPVMKVGDHTVTSSEFSFFYTNKVNSCASYGSYIGIESGKPLNEQYVSKDGASMVQLLGLDTSILSEDKLTGDTYDITWAQVFAAAAKKDVASVYAVYNEAIENGYEMTEHMKEDIEEGMEQMQEYADAKNMSLNSFIAGVFGKGCDASGYRDYLTAQTIASNYAGTLSYSADEIEAKRAEAPEDYEVVTYFQYTTTASDFVEAAEDGSKPEATDAEKKQAKDAAEAMLADFNVENASIKADALRTSVSSSTTEEAANWLFDTAADNEVKLFQKDDTYYVLKLVDKTDYVTSNYLQIALSKEEAEGEPTAAEKLEKIEAALQEDASAESFEALAEEYSTAHEAEVNNCLRSGLTGINTDAVLWSMEAHAAGDYKVFETDSNIVILFYAGEGMKYSDVVVTSVLANEHIEQITDAALADCAFNEEAALFANGKMRLN